MNPTSRDEVMRDAIPSLIELKGTVQGTLLYLALYICFVSFQSFSKFYLYSKKKKEAKDGKVSFHAIKYYNSKDKLALAGDRAVGNYVEFAIVFLPCLWLHAIFVDPSQSFTCCAIYTASRALYPFVFVMKMPTILFSTVPCYLVKGYLIFQLFRHVAIAS